MDFLALILQDSSLLFVVFVFATLSGLVSERAGVVNIAIEGMMTIGALIFALFGKNIGTSWGNWSQIVALIVAGVAGVLFSSLHAFATITLKADQVISGIALNILAAAISLFVVQLPGNNGFISYNNAYKLPKIGTNDFFNIYLLLAIVVVIILGIFLKYSKWGLRHDAVGENPSAAAAAGISVAKRRYFAVLLAGFLAAMAGAVFTMNASKNFRGAVNGYGFLALAILIFGQWRVYLVVIGAALFSILTVTGVRISFKSGDLSQWIGKNKELFNALPFLISLFVLIFTSKWSRSPKALGKPFDQKQR